MKTSIASALFAGLFLSATAFAAPPADAPAGTTGQCKDGSYTNVAAKKGACRGHKGVKDWYVAAAAAPAAAAAAPAAAAAAPAAAAAAAPAAATAAAAAPAAASKHEVPKPAAVAAPGGGADKVWVNDSTKVYHCFGDRWYGKTKEGSYMSESDAVAKGYKGDHGKTCKK